MAFDINSVSGFDTQALHVFFASTLVLELSRYLPLYAAVLISLVVSFVKEAAEATGIAPWEPRQTWSSSLIDFAFLSAGVLLATILKLV